MLKSQSRPVHAALAVFALCLVLALSAAPASAQQRWEYEPPRSFRADEAANIRQAPDLGSEILGTVVRGQTMKVTARVGDFYEVSLIMGGFGYIHRIYLMPLGMLTVPEPPRRPAGDRWQTMAYSYATGALGTAYNQYTLENAWSAALNACGRKDCRVTVNSRGGCVAMALGSDGVAGFGSGEDTRSAYRAARQECKDRGGRGCGEHRAVCQR
ncbi:MAG: DUF4189 domain-containing protein [Oceanidesulfovibrio sp.]